MRYLLSLIFLISLWTKGQTQDTTLKFVANTSAIRFVVFDSVDKDLIEVGRYSVNEDKWTIVDTMKMIKMMYKTITIKSETEEWLRQRIDLMYELFRLEPDVANGNKEAFFKFHKLSAQLHNLERNPPQFKP